MDARSVVILTLLKEQTKQFEQPMVFSLIKTFGRDPFLVLISCLISLRARDKTTLPICRQLFTRAHTPQEILAIPVEELEALLRPIGFYRNKTKTIRVICQILLDAYQGEVPQTEEELLKLPGVGRKTANLVLAEGFGTPAICVDTHVHRLANHFGIVKTRAPEETERALQAIFEPSEWLELNRYFVMWGQNVCLPRQSSKCLTCPALFAEVCN